MKTMLAIVAMASSLTAYAQSEQSTTKTKTSDVIQGNKPADQKDIDQEITNAKLRAESGSKSKHSLSLEANYSGGTVENPVAYRRPDIVGGAATEPLSSLVGEFSYRYRLTSGQSLNAGVGLRWNTPGYDLEAQNRDSGTVKTEASNPFLGYKAAFKAAGLQNVYAAQFNKYTSSQLVKRGKYNWNFDTSHTVLYEVGTSGLQLGLNAGASYYEYYERLAGQTEIEIGLYPFAEYVINDKVNIRTVYRGNTYGSTREANMTFQPVEITQSLGVGIAATRDLFFYPNIQWDWRDTRAEKTNVALYSAMNFF